MQWGLYKTEQYNIDHSGYLINENAEKIKYIKQTNDKLIISALSGNDWHSLMFFYFDMSKMTFVVANTVCCLKWIQGHFVTDYLDVFSAMDLYCNSPYFRQCHETNTFSLHPTTLMFLLLASWCLLENNFTPVSFNMVVV